MKKKGVPSARGGHGTSQDDDTGSSVFVSSPTDRNALQQIKSQREALQKKVDEIDDRIFNLETVYLRDATEIGSLFDGYGTSPAASVRLASNTPAGAKRRGMFPETDRIFSSSSGTSLANIRKRMRDLESAAA